jgi:predicted Zn finger-like uncharacterized protein
MRAQCPQCGFTGNIRDDLVPETGRTIACPRCKNTFFARRDGDRLGRPLSEHGDRGRLRPAVTGSAPVPRSAARKTNPFLIIAIAALFLMLGYLGGYQYRGFIDGKTGPPTRVEKPGKAPKKHPFKPGRKPDREPLMTPMGTPTTGIPADGPGGAPGWKSEGSFTADALFAALSAMPPGQVRNFCRKNAAAEVNGNGTIREMKKTSTADGIIGTYSVTIQVGPNTRVVVDSKMTESYLANFTVGGAVGFIGTLSDYLVSGTIKTIYLRDGMIVVH